MAEINVSIQVDSNVKERAEELFSELGIDMNIAVNLFLRQSIRLGKIPFDLAVDRPNRETIEAMLEARRIVDDPNTRRYKTVDELIADLEAECNEEE